MQGVLGTGDKKRYHQRHDVVRVSPEFLTVSDHQKAFIREVKKWSGEKYWPRLAADELRDQVDQVVHHLMGGFQEYQSYQNSLKWYVRILAYKEQTLINL